MRFHDEPLSHLYRMDPYTRICFECEGFNDEQVKTETSEDQLYTEEAVIESYNRWKEINGNIDEKYVSFIQ